MGGSLPLPGLQFSNMKTEALPVSLICCPLYSRFMSYMVEGFMWFLGDSGRNIDLNQMSGLEPQSCHLVVLRAFLPVFHSK